MADKHNMFDLVMIVIYIILLGAGTLAWWYFSSYIRKKASEKLPLS